MFLFSEASQRPIFKVGSPGSVHSSESPSLADSHDNQGNLQEFMWQLLQDDDAMNSHTRDEFYFEHVSIS